MDGSPYNNLQRLTVKIFLIIEGYHENPVSIPLRVVFLSVWLSSLFTYCYYTAILTSSLAMSTDVAPFSTVSQAVYNEDWQITVLNGSNTLNHVQVGLEVTNLFISIDRI